MDRVNGSPTLGSLVFTSGPLQGKTYKIAKAELTIGRSPGNDVEIPDPSVSRHHAKMALRNGMWLISKIELKNKIIINQQDMPESVLKDRDTVTLGTGTTAFLFSTEGVTVQPTDAPALQPTNYAEASPPPQFPSHLSQQQQDVPQPNFDTLHSSAAPPIPIPDAGMPLASNRPSPASPYETAQASEEELNAHFQQIPHEQPVQRTRQSAPAVQQGPPIQPVQQPIQYDAPIQQKPVPIQHYEQQVAQQEFQEQQRQPVQQAEPYAPPAHSVPPVQSMQYPPSAQPVQPVQQPAHSVPPVQPIQYPPSAQPVQPLINTILPTQQVQQPQFPRPAMAPRDLEVTGTQKAAPFARNDISPQQYGPGGTVSHGVPTIEVKTNTDREKHSYALIKPIINIGRAPDNDIVIDRPTISGYHAQILREGNQLVFIHPNPKQREGKTTNGIDYNGQSIVGTQQFRKALARGDVFRISDEHGTLVTLTYNDGSGAAQDITPELRPIPLDRTEITLGRLPDNTVVLTHPQISGHHARLERLQDGSYRIVDLGSTNHVFVNTKRVTNHVLQLGDEIRVGPYKLTYNGRELTQQDESNGIRIDALHLTQTGNKNFVIVNDISIAIPSRKFVAVVGGSGAGKSTLLRALNGLQPAKKGAVLYNGQDYYSHLAAFSTQLGYVPQDDIVHTELTVGRALYYAAKLRLPSDYTGAQIKERIEEVLADVDMKAKRNQLISTLSGGQRKRVSIALELLSNPNIFFLDEPTSGLDPGLDRKMMSLLRTLADKGRTIVLVTHATNNINSCDYICFLCRGGRLAYFGPPEEALAYFGKDDFAEIYSALEPTDENPKIPEQAEEKFKRSQEYQQYVVQPITQGPASRISAIEDTVSVKPPKRGNPWKQFMLLSGRYLELLKNDVGNLAILILQAPIIGLILYFMASSAVFQPTSIVTCPPDSGVPLTASTNRFDCSNYEAILTTQRGQAIYTQRTGKAFMGVPDAIQHLIINPSGIDAQKILLIMAFAAVMFGCLNGAREIVKESAIYKRERTVNLGIVPYMFSKIVVLGVFCLIQSAILVLIVNLRSPFQTSIFLPPVIEIYITMALTSLAGLMVGLTLSAVVPNSDRAMSFVPIILIPQIVFSGAIFPLYYLGWPFAAYWAMSGMGSTIGLHGDKLEDDPSMYQGTLHSTVSPIWAATHLFLVWIALAVMIVALGFLIAYFLKQKDVKA